MKDIIGYEGYYKITSDGRIYSIRSNKFLKLNYKKNGYVYIELNVKGNSKSHRVHRLVAEAFIPNPENKPIVHHINGDKSDNRVKNLEWVTVSENTKMAFEEGLIVPPMKSRYFIMKDEIALATCSSYQELMERTGYGESMIAHYVKSKKPLKRGEYKNCTIISIRV